MLSEHRMNGEGGLAMMLNGSETCSGVCDDSTTRGPDGQRIGLATQHSDSREPRPSGKATASNLRMLVEWQQYKCALTGRGLTPEDAQADHIIPLCDGGTNALDNIQIVCREANMAKSTLSQSQFLRLCRDVVACHSTPPGSRVPFGG